MFINGDRCATVLSRYQHHLDTEVEAAASFARFSSCVYTGKSPSFRSELLASPRSPLLSQHRKHNTDRRWLGNTGGGARILSASLISECFLRSLKTTLQKKLSSDSLDLSGIPLSTRDIRQVAFYLQTHGDRVISVDISFTELHDDNLRLLLPLLATMPKLGTLALNGNRLTLAILKDLTEMLKDPKMFSSLAWIDLGNNLDIFTMPQPLLVALRRRCSLKSSLPTIYEYTEGQPYCYHLETSIEEPSHCEEEEEDGDEEELSKDSALHECER